MMFCGRFFDVNNDYIMVCVVRKFLKNNALLEGARALRTALRSGHQS